MLFVGCSVLVTVYFVVWCCSCGFWLVLVLGFALFGVLLGFLFSLYSLLFCVLGVC